MFDRKTNIFIANDGTEIKIKKTRPFKVQILSGQIRDKYIANDEPLTPPAFYVDVVGGKRQRHYHTKKTIYKDIDERLYKDDLSDETIQEWEAHLDALDRLESDIALANMDLILQDGTDFELPENDDWIEDQESQGFKVPENYKKKKSHYLFTEVLELEETQELVKIIMQVSQNNMERKLEEAEAISESFRDPMEK